MGAALIVPVLALVVLAVIWFVYASAKARRGRRAEATLPDEPYARREEEVRRLKAEHAAADPALTRHPERRP
jgi:cbb3-type cytochrome oxidase subunit 3